LPLIYSKVKESLWDDLTTEAIERVGLIHRKDYETSKLSGGEKQRVAIARALVNRPKILIADEPTGNLDPIITRDIVQLLEKINEFGTTVLLVTHNREIVNFIKRRVITLDRGIMIGDQSEGRYVI